MRGAAYLSHPEGTLEISHAALLQYLKLDYKQAPFEHYRVFQSLIFVIFAFKKQVRGVVNANFFADNYTLGEASQVSAKMLNQKKNTLDGRESG